MTLAGCLYREESIPGRSPNLAEKAGINRDYILADASMAPSSSSTPGQAGATAGLTSGRMYKVMKLDEAQLKTLVGKRVEVTGSVKPDNDAKPGDRSNYTNLPNIEATSIREVAGATCVSTPAGASTSPSTTSPAQPSSPTTPDARPNPDPTSPRPIPDNQPASPENPRPDTNR